MEVSFALKILNFYIKFFKVWIFKFPSFFDSFVFVFLNFTNASGIPEKTSLINCSFPNKPEIGLLQLISCPITQKYHNNIINFETLHSDSQLRMLEKSSRAPWLGSLDIAQFQGVTNSWSCVSLTKLLIIHYPNFILF